MVEDEEEDAVSSERMKEKSEPLVSLPVTFV